MDNDNLRWAHMRRRAMTVLVIAVLVGASGTLSCAVVQVSESARAADRRAERSICRRRLRDWRTESRTCPACG